MGALTRPTEEIKIKKKSRSRRSKMGILTRMAARVARNSSVNCLSAAAWLWSRVRTSCAATFTTAVPLPGVHPEVALAASASRADELKPTAGRGSDAAFCGSDAAFPARRLGGDRKSVV